MEVHLLLHPRASVLLSGHHPASYKISRRNHQLRVQSSPVQSQSVRLQSSLNPCSKSSHQSLFLKSQIESTKLEHKPGPLDGLLLAFFRRKMAEEVGWDSEKPGYDGLIDVANRMMVKCRTNLEIEESAVRVLISLFPPFLLQLFRMLIAPLGGGRIASAMLARATALLCQWLMGPCSVNSVDLPDGSSWTSGVSVERCKYLEESKCLGICTNTCKLPTQTFFKECMGIPLLMEPNFSNYSCQFKFGVLPPPKAFDKALQEPCLEICANAYRRKNSPANTDVAQCPKA